MATFRAGETDAVEVTIPASGEIAVPHEATQAPGLHLLVVRGMADGVDLYSCNIRYQVLARAKCGGAASQPPTPDALQQYVEATRQDRAAAQAAAQEAEQSAATAADAAADAWVAAEHYPIVRGGTWWVWQGSPDGSGGYVDTGQAARGPAGNYRFATNAEIDAIMQL